MFKSHTSVKHFLDNSTFSLEKFPPGFSGQWVLSQLLSERNTDLHIAQYHHVLMPAGMQY